MTDALTLNLGCDIIYESAALSLEEELNRIMCEEDGFDSIFIYEANSLKLIKSGKANLYKEESHNSKVILKEGRYLFKQLPLPESEDAALRAFIPYLNECSVFYIRLLKESKLEAIMQLLIPKSL